MQFSKIGHELEMHVKQAQKRAKKMVFKQADQSARKCKFEQLKSACLTSKQRGDNGIFKQANSFKNLAHKAVKQQSFTRILTLQEGKNQQCS